MTIIDVHHDERIYPNSRSFIPERWLENPKTEYGTNLNRYFVAFGKGARSCLGIKYVLILCTRGTRVRTDERKLTL